MIYAEKEKKNGYNNMYVNSLSLGLSEQEDKDHESKHVKDTVATKDTKISPSVLETPANVSFVVLVTHSVGTVVTRTSSIFILNVTKSTILKVSRHVLTTSLSRRNINLVIVAVLTDNRYTIHDIDNKAFNHIMVRIQPVHPGTPEVRHL